VAAAAKQDLLTLIGRQKRLDLLEQIDWVDRSQLGWSGHPAANQNASVEPTQVGYTANKSAFRLPTPNG
jgi:hypothetical protein